MGAAKSLAAHPVSAHRAADSGKWLRRRAHSHFVNFAPSILRLARYRLYYLFHLRKAKP